MFTLGGVEDLFLGELLVKVAEVSLELSFLDQGGEVILVDVQMVDAVAEHGDNELLRGSSGLTSYGLT